jgi:hypothetical protein
MKEISLKGLTEEQIAKVKECKSIDEMLKLAKEDGVELTEEQLEVVNGGMCTSSTKCPACGCRSFNWDEGQHVRRYYCCKCHEFVYEIYF